MATIQILDLHPTGADLFQDSENYLNALTDEELDLTRGASPRFPRPTFLSRFLGGW